MKSIIVASRHYLVAFLLILLTCASVMGQVKLREAVDYDSDGKADYPIFRPSDNFWYIYTSGGNFIYQPWGLANEDHMTPGDFDGDHKGDIAIWREATGLWFIINSATSTVSIIQWGADGDVPVGRDYDGDGKTDYAIVRRTGGQMIWYILPSSNFIGTSSPFGLATDYTAPGDYDGDGKFDIAIQRPGETPTTPALFYIQRSTEGLAVVQWGIGKDLVVPGDYDGDGKTDIAVVREGDTPDASLVWYVIKSSNGTSLSVPFGITLTDLTAQGDYDGDGKTDIAIWRETTGDFYIANSLNSSLSVLHWGAPNDVPVLGYDTH
ncbi:MAG TPA: VCBS repeat-containing protein [Pyrinomonadaceae bacterium]|nr:VCBS repeat-containing protein [Pyrinomonadaceae bacterium]